MYLPVGPLDHVIVRAASTLVILPFVLLTSLLGFICAGTGLILGPHIYHGWSSMHATIHVGVLTILSSITHFPGTLAAWMTHWMGNMPRPEEGVITAKNRRGVTAKLGRQKASVPPATKAARRQANAQVHSRKRTVRVVDSVPASAGAPSASPFATVSVSPPISTHSNKPRSDNLLNYSPQMLDFIEAAANVGPLKGVEHTVAPVPISCSLMTIADPRGRVSLDDLLAAAQGGYLFSAAASSTDAEDQTPSTPPEFQSEGAPSPTQTARSAPCQSSSAEVVSTSGLSRQPSASINRFSRPTQADLHPHTLPPALGVSSIRRESRFMASRDSIQAAVSGAAEASEHRNHTAAGLSADRSSSQEELLIRPGSAGEPIMERSSSQAGTTELRFRQARAAAAAAVVGLLKGRAQTAAAQYTMETSDRSAEKVGVAPSAFHEMSRWASGGLLEGVAKSEGSFGSAMSRQHSWYLKGENLQDRYRDNFQEALSISG